MCKGFYVFKEGKVIVLTKASVNTLYLHNATERSENHQGLSGGEREDIKELQW